MFVTLVGRRVYSIVLSLLVVPPLTSGTLLPLIKGVKSWRKLAKRLICAHDKAEYGLPLLPDSEDLDVLQSHCDSDEDCLKAVIEKFLQGKGGQYEQPSWTAVLQCLYSAHEFHLASNIRSYSEALQGVCTVICNKLSV